MVAPYNQTVQNTAKCPHGFPVGTCPICSGAGGAKPSKNRDKPRVPGEMSYNECLAEWHKIQARKEAEAQAKLNNLKNAEKISFQHKMLVGLVKIQKNFDRIIQHLGKVPLVVGVPIKLAINYIARPIANFILKTIPSAIKNIQVFFNNVTNFINSVTEKLATVLGEIKNFAENKIFDKAKKSLKTLLSLFTESGTDEENEEAEKIKAREIKKVLKNLFRIKRYPEKDKDAECKLTKNL